MKTESLALKACKLSMEFPRGGQIFADLSFEISPGEMIAFIGPSGCGKSTLLRLLAGLLQPTSGEISYHDSAGELKATPEMAFIFQDSTLLPWCSVLENIEMPLRLRGVPKETRSLKAVQLAQTLGLENRVNHYPRELSGGMKMRVSLARALSLNPQLMFLDEPFGALDAITRNRLNEDFLRLHESAQWTTFLVTHSVTEAAFFADRVFILSSQRKGIQRVLPVKLPQPRGLKTRELEEFQSVVQQITTSLNSVLATD